MTAKLTTVGLIAEPRTALDFPVNAGVACYFNGHWFPGQVAGHVRGGRSIEAKFRTGTGAERTTRYSLVHVEDVVGGDGKRAKALRVALLPEDAPQAPQKAQETPAPKAPAAAIELPEGAEVPVTVTRGDKKAQAASDQASLRRAELDAEATAKRLAEAEIVDDHPEPLKAGKAWYLRLVFSADVTPEQAQALCPWLQQGIAQAGLPVVAVELIPGGEDES